MTKERDKEIRPITKEEFETGGYGDCSIIYIEKDE